MARTVVQTVTKLQSFEHAREHAGCNVKSLNLQKCTKLLLRKYTYITASTNDYLKLTTAIHVG